MNIFFVIALAILGQEMNMPQIFWVMYVIGVICWVISVIIKSIK